MPDREKVIKGLYEAVKVMEDHVPARYIGYAEQACWDALALLREHEPVAPRYKDPYHAYCGACGCRIPLKIKARYCHKCGKAVKWNA